MSTSRSAGWLAAATLLLLGCGGREADFIIELQRGGHQGPLDIYLCDEVPTSRCKHIVPLAAGDGQAAREIGVFINNGTRRLDVNFQLGTPVNMCAHFVVDVGMDAQVKVQLDAQGGVPFTLLDCTSCTVPDLSCTYAGR